MKDRVDIPTKDIPVDRPRRPRIAVLLNASAILATTVAIIGSGGPKLPPFQSD